ncbi:MAG: glycosyltransferase family 2 protein [Shewanella sp.]|uniref:glycosyltransferase family 2 protein n=1 Tax=Shewanella sp. TaxID=50422 RepID=UPI003F41702B
MKISIITVCYNSEKTIRDTIESVLAQDHSNVEYIIVDGASKDRTLEIIDEYKDNISVVISEPDRGIYDAMNKGISLATGDIVGILNSDDFYETKTVLTDVVNSMKDDKKLDMIYGDVVFVDGNDLQKIKRYYALPKFKGNLLRFGWMPPHPATFIRKSLYEKIGLYKTKFKISADYEFFVRAILIGKAKYRHVNSVFVRMRMGGVSTGGIKSTITLNREIIKACQDNGVYTNIIFLLTKIPFKLLELLRRPKQND